MRVHSLVKNECKGGSTRDDRNNKIYIYDEVNGTMHFFLNRLKLDVRTIIAAVLHAWLT